MNDKATTRICLLELVSKFIQTKIERERDRDTIENKRCIEQKTNE